MTSTKNLKIWTIVAHFFIVVGFGHGILTLGFVELFSFATLLSGLWMVAITALAGQAAIIYSIFSKKLAFHLLGLVFLWLSVIYYIVDFSGDNYAYFATVTAVPCFICTLMVFVIKPLKQLYKWVQNEN